MVGPSTANMNQIRVTWSGFPGGPGISTFYADGAANPSLTNLRAFYLAIASLMPTEVTLSFPTSGDVLDPKTGTLVGAWSVGSAPANVSGTVASGTNATSGPYAVWTTNDVSDGRAVKGRTFIVPCGANLWGADGTLNPGNKTILQTAGAQIVGATPTFVIWHRPKKGPKPAGGGPAPVIRQGSWSVITGITVPLKPAVLTSRRD